MCDDLLPLLVTDSTPGGGQISVDSSTLTAHICSSLGFKILAGTLDDTTEWAPFEKGGLQNDSFLGWACGLSHLMGKPTRTPQNLGKETYPPEWGSR